MRKLQAYTVKEFFPPFFLAICVFTFVMLLDKLLDLLEMIVSRGVPLRTVLEIFLLLLPSMVAVIIPMAILAGVIMAIGRMTGDLEITAMKAMGISIFTPMKPLLLVSCIIGSLLIIFNNNILPDANHMAKNLMLDIGRLRPTATIIPGMFVDEIENYRILVGSKDDLTGELHHVVIHENIPGRPERTIVANTGKMEPISANRMRLLLSDGEMHEIADRGKTYRRLQFETYTLELTRDSELTRRDRESRGDREMSSNQMRSLIDSLSIRRTELVDSLSNTGGIYIRAVLDHNPVQISENLIFPDNSPDPMARYNRTRNRIATISANLKIIQDMIGSGNRNINKYRVEIEKKYSIPFACFIFVLLGVPLGLTSRRGSAGIALGISLLVIVVYYLFLVGGEQLADRGVISPFTAMWAPNAFFGILGGYLTLRSLHEGNPVPLPDIRNLLRRKKSNRGNN